MSEKQLTVWQKRVFALVKKIPKGRITTYKIIAKRLHNSQGSRAVGNALKNNPFLLVIPCHRIIKSNGEIGGYVGGIGVKMKLLKQEGILIDISQKRIKNSKQIFNFL